MNVKMKLRYLRHAYWLRWPRRIALALPLLFVGTCIADKGLADRWRWFGGDGPPPMVEAGSGG